jgi:hypothetical protein
VCLTNQRFNSKAKEQAAINGVSLIDQDGIAQLLANHSVTLGRIEKFIFTSWSDAVPEL